VRLATLRVHLGVARVMIRAMRGRTAKVLARRRVERAAEKNREVLDVTDVILLDLLIEMTDRHVFDHALAQRADGLVDHGDTPVSHEVTNPMILRQDETSRYAAPRSH
jgi:hypothetical protein